MLNAFKHQQLVTRQRLETAILVGADVIVI
jgi:hypothetical protein